MVKWKIGVLGSAFDPPTCGHLDVLKQASHFYDNILLVPSAAHAFSKKMQPFNDRLEMLNVFLKDALLESCHLEVCDLEYHLLKDKPDHPVYTFDLLTALEHHYGSGVELGFIRGPDNANAQVWQRFYKSDEIEKRWSIFTAQERIRARSSQVRQSIAESGVDEPGNKDLQALLTPSVYQFIQQTGLYCS